MCNAARTATASVPPADAARRILPSRNAASSCTYASSSSLWTVKGSPRMVTLNGRGTRSAPGRGARPDSAENPLETRLHLDPLTLVPSHPLEGFLVGAERAGQPRGQRRTLPLELLVMRQERRQPFLQDFQRLPAFSGQHRKRCGRTLVAAS